MQEYHAKTWHLFWYLGHYEYMLKNNKLIAHWIGLNANAKEEIKIDEISILKDDKYDGTREAGRFALIIFLFGLLLSFIFEKLGLSIYPYVLVSTTTFAVFSLIYRFYQYQYIDLYDKDENFLIAIRMSRRNKKLVKLIEVLRNSINTDTISITGK
ncbi:MAG: hypothetical protein JXR70_03735 [Spirochaetales bacterium]|nr:hypothetical protein [Spirochaetales bacterium]